MFWKKKNKLCEHKFKNNDSEEKPCEVNIETPIRRIINGKLYDTSKAKNICSIILQHGDIPNYDLSVFCLCGEKVSIYKGNTEWFIEYYRFIKPVSEEWIKGILGTHNVEKYIELFGEPEEA